MSVVAAKVYRDRISIAADSILVSGSSKRTDSKFQKLENINDMIIGAVGLAQDCSLMFHYCANHKPVSATERDVLAFVVEFEEWKCVKMQPSFGVMEDECVNKYILIFDGRCFLIEGLLVYQVDNYIAIGAGDDFATAALYLGHSPREAVKTACELSCYVAEPIVEFEVGR